MPSLDDRDRVVGPVLRELESGTYEKTFLVLDFGSHTLYGYAGRPGNSKELSELTPTIEINCQWITKVRIASFRPRVLHCLEIGLPTGCQFFSVDSEEERDEWVESIRRCSMGQGAGKPVATTAAPAAKKEVAYRTVLVGGKVQKIPVQSNGSGAAESAAVGKSGGKGQKKTRGFPRVIHAGHGIKLGAVRKSWKKRFFVLTEVSVGYYKTIDEVEPIRTVSVGDMTSCAVSKESSGKEHMLELVTPSRTYYIQMETEEEMEQWVKAFRSIMKTVRGSHQPVRQEPDSDSDETELAPGISPDGTLV
ncbi:Pleckstrin homology domain-containing family A member 2 [Geodia barretti]|uniref:Pleckstrin homology domain-containing family A member 2 n=2 Tax=Geodia barretti TaxID=519541 RepID=A0AA35T5E2_GEOBA|nr:Pleckstrin homology domain-containing family A member 2 [Geodia barretti]